MKLIIGNRAYSSWSMRGWLALKHAGLEFEELVVPMFDEAWEQRREGGEFAPSLGKVPILWDGDTVLWDSLAIIEFCADRVGRERFWPEDDAARARSGRRTLLPCWLQASTSFLPLALRCRKAPAMDLSRRESRCCV